MRRLLLACALIASALPAFAVQPDEILKDPALEARARALSIELRCLVCQSQSIDDSDATIARDLRILVRERLEAGDSDDQVKAFLVDRYGEFVLLKPRFTWHTAVLWGTPPVLLIVGGALAFGVFRRRRSAPASSLTQAEEARIEALLAKDD
ncbi:cytochrome c biogenesis protein [Kaistia sp. 32K]|uniref:cytochrome c-type biogenesis protein n=1 Tax=Kaistia sp. 32K TaxID=2795690 RepID=UPI00191685D7|nr:cytochrome c-type biogenesis protein [Kaistia sp. 32K]BCP52849.1 cytochrome c biogenesis protein [Kaistia sp. 32K]